MATKTFSCVILSGGSGTRLWPLSRQMLPKQFLPLISEHSMLQETALRASRLHGARQPIIVCTEDLRFIVAEQMRDIGIEPQCIIIEPMARNTAPAIAAVALAVTAEHDSPMLVLPADHLIRDELSFSNAVDCALKCAFAGDLVAFGVPPTAPETGYGYIELGAAHSGQNSYAVTSFIEKPDRLRAKAFLAAGNYLWNSGMFMMSASIYLQELQRYRPDILDIVKDAWKKRAVDRDYARLDSHSFDRCPSVSIDYAVMERTSHAVVVPVDIGWSDIGSWESLWQNSSKDINGNAIRGDVDVQDTHNSYIRAENRLLSVNGLDDIVVIETSDAVLVTSREKSQSVKDIVARLANHQRSEHLNHLRVYRPWGYYESIDRANGYQVKRLMLKPGEAISLQLHRQRSEHWIVVSGTARVTRGDEIISLSSNESTYIPVGMKHRLENATEEPLYIVEVQSGTYLGEDDIVRFEDRYSRS